jgi:hypothetical protein
MTTQDIQNISYGDTQASKMMLGNYQVWPHIEIDYGPEVPEIVGDYLAFATYGEADISFYASNTTVDSIMYETTNGAIRASFVFDVIYSFDGITWTDVTYWKNDDGTYSFDSIHITEDTPVYIKRKDTSKPVHSCLYLMPFTNTPDARFCFTMSGDAVHCSGKLKAWIDIDKVNGVHQYGPAFNGLFYNCTTLQSANIDLQDTETYIEYYSYARMFDNCTALVAGPKVIPNKKVGGYVFQGMFSNCTSLVAAPEILTNEANGANVFCEMFKNCTSLIVGPSKISLNGSLRSCCKSMFEGCTSLIRATIVELTDGTDINETCYFMYCNCTALSYCEIRLPDTATYSNAFICMFDNCSSLKYIRLKGGLNSNMTGSFYNWMRGVRDGGILVIDNDAPTDIEKKLFFVNYGNEFYYINDSWKISRE